MRRRVPNARRLVGAMVVIVLSGGGGAAEAQERVVGYLDYQGRREIRERGGDLTSHLTTLRVDANTFLWRPWIADLSGGLGLTFRQTRFDTATQEGHDVTGSARLRVFPRSRFPLEVFADRINSEVSGELVGPTFTQTVVGLTQSYTPTAGRRYVLTARHTEREDERRDLGGTVTRTTNDFASIGANHTHGRHQLDAKGDYDRLSRDQPQRFDQRVVGLLRHRYGAGPGLSVDSLASMTDTDIDEVSGETSNRLQQLNSNLFWRPGTTRPTLVTASVLANQQDIETTTGAAIALRTWVGTGGVTHQATRELTLRSTANVVETEAGDTRQQNSLLRAGATYAPRERPVGRFLYRFSVVGDLGHRREATRGETQELTAALSHGLSITKSLPEGSRSGSASQQLTSLHDSRGRTQSALTHALSADWSSFGTARHANARFLASDTRRFDSTFGDTGFQLLNVQVNGRAQFDRLSSWQGNLTWQMSRNSTMAGQSPWVTSTSANLTYQRERVFGQPLLRFTSEFRAISDDLANATQDRFVVQRRARWTWTSRLDYLIGRTQISLRGALADVDGRRQTLLYLQVRRYFGQQAR